MLYYYIKKTIFITLFNFLLILLIIFLSELTLFLSYKSELLKFKVNYIPDYLKKKPYAELVFDKNGSSIYANGSKFYFSSREYDNKGFVIGDFDKFNESKELWYFFGDSYLEGLQVEKSKTFASLLEKKNDVNIINLGVGGTGTFQQYLRFKTLLEYKIPNEIYLFFLPQNDILNNSSKYSNINLPKALYTDIKNFPKIIFTQNVSSEKLNDNYVIKIAKNLFITRILYNEYKQYKAKKLLQKVEYENSPFLPDSLNPFLNVYKQNYNNDFWEEAWIITEKSILEMNNLSKKYKINFSLILVPDSLQIFHYKSPLKNYNFNYPNERLIKFCNENKISCYDALPFFQNYLDEINLKFPYYSFKHDGHYSEIGHETMYKFLQSIIELKNNYKN